MRKFAKNDEAFTGLEAAIVLIAFVVVAAVFSYVMLGAGFFTSQKSQEVVHTSVEQASASIEVRGDVYGYDKAKTGEIVGLQFNLALTAGGSPVDINKTVMTYATADTVQVLTRDLTKDADTLAVGEWTVIKKVGNNDTDNLVERGEQFVINVKLPQTLKANEHFNLEVKPAAGAALGLKRTAPPQIDAANLLY
ncbi:flagellin FlaB [Methanofollis sp. W23]|uniref:flagellin n=1 Tax=Methanofollis sp. W23 TaxID=2817849 RepID=UPI001AE37085|nr:flagellin [Methanofollis sp. W23]MBP2145175.1 flagellin FlaB [Methanofollis sp. W23]